MISGFGVTRDRRTVPFVNSLPSNLGRWHGFFYDLTRLWGEDITLAPLWELEYVNRFVEMRHVPFL